MKIAVIGAGAIGSLIAGYLANKDEQVVLIGHLEQVAAISGDGLTINGVRGNLTVRLPVKIQLKEKADLVILATKIQDLPKALEENFAYLKETRILTVQNGVRAEKLVTEQLGKDNLFSSIVMFAATYQGLGQVIHNFDGNWILGRVDSGAREVLEEISKVTGKIFPSPLSDDIMGMKWLKLFINANNCLPAILGKSMQEAFKNIAICKISLRIWQEGWNIVEKARIGLVSLPDFPIERIRNLVSLPLDKAAQIFSKIMTNLSKEPLYGSILQSIKRDRPSEIDYINGEFVNLAGSTSQSAPLNERLVLMVHQVEKTKQFFGEEELIKQTNEFLN
ncbi:MAG: 2-dehydropantoate 2-reductase [Omnitrophica bacterium]|nr:2-dehydropantoate 2-reductase [Candidatus Omnitrophota bacterium]